MHDLIIDPVVYDLIGAVVFLVVCEWIVRRRVRKAVDKLDKPDYVYMVRPVRPKTENGQ